MHATFHSPRECGRLPRQVDTITLEEVDRLARQPRSVVISCEWDLNLDQVVEQIWEELDLVRVYTKKKGNPPEFGQPFIMRRGV